MSKMKQQVQVTVAGNYSPSVIELKQGIPAEIQVTRINTQGCLETIHSSEMDFETDLPLNEPQTITISTDKVGEYAFSCGMDMVFGKVVVK